MITSCAPFHIPIEMDAKPFIVGHHVVERGEDDEDPPDDDPPNYTAFDAVGMAKFECTMHNGRSREYLGDLVNVCG